MLRLAPTQKSCLSLVITSFQRFNWALMACYRHSMELVHAGCRYTSPPSTLSPVFYLRIIKIVLHVAASVRLFFFFKWPDLKRTYSDTFKRFQLNQDFFS